MTPRIVGAIIRKDLRAFGRDRFFVFMTIIGLVAYTVVFYLLPSSVDETVALGISGREAIGPVLADLGGAPGLEVIEFDTRDALAAALQEDGGPVAGLSFPDGFAEDLAAGRPTTVEVLLPAGIPAEFAQFAEGMVDQIAIAVSGEIPAASPLTRTIVLGADRVGDQVSLQEQLRPLLVVFILMIETLALATLVATEVHGRTVIAILASPATIVDFLVAKGVFGTMLAFAEAGLLLAVIGGLSIDPALLLLIVLLGAILVTGLAMIAGSFGKDFLNVLLISMALMIPLMIPAFGVLFPGSPGLWVKLLPSFGLVDAIVSVTVDGAGWSGAAPNLAMLAAWCGLLFGAGMLILRKKVVSL